MKTCVWYEIEEKIPPKSGYYLAFKGLSMGDDETRIDYYYWDARRAEWRDSQISGAHYANVVYWSEADPVDWYENWHLPNRKEKASVAEQDAWAAVEAAMERYEMIRALTAESR